MPRTAPIPENAKLKALLNEATLGKIIATRLLTAEHELESFNDAWQLTQDTKANAWEQPD